MLFLFDEVLCALKVLHMCYSTCEQPYNYPPLSVLVPKVTGTGVVNRGLQLVMCSEGMSEP